MKLRHKILSGLGLVLAVAVTAMAILMSHTSPCDSPPLTTQITAPMMKGVVRRCYGSPDVIQVVDLPKPIPGEHQVLVKVHAASLNPLDWHDVEGTPYLVRLDAGFGRPKDPRLGVDFAGTVEAAGEHVTRFKPGDEVFGARSGALADYVLVNEERAITHKPSNITFEQAAAVPVAAITALQALRDGGQLKAGQRVLINGASGGVGTFAVQIAKVLGADVTGVCSTKNVALVRSIGADHVIDYTREDFTQGAQRYDLILDNVETHSLSEYKRALTPAGTYVMVGSTTPYKWFGFLAKPIAGWATSPFTRQKIKLILADIHQKDLDQLAQWLQSGTVVPVIDRTFKLQESAEALRYLERGHAKGKVVLVLN